MLIWSICLSGSWAKKIKEFITLLILILYSILLRKISLNLKEKSIYEMEIYLRVIKK